RMLMIIKDRLKRKVCDDVLEVAWSTLWNVTDETAINCQRFLDSHGMKFFLECLSVSYNAAGVLSHMASDGEEAWKADTPREIVLHRMVDNIERWSLNSDRNINYRSFEPILHLAQVYHTPECQHWAIWALANLTTVYPEKYCTLVEAEGGLKILGEVVDDPRPYSRIKELATIVIQKCMAYRVSMVVLNYTPLTEAPLPEQMAHISPLCDSPISVFTFARGGTYLPRPRLPTIAIGGSPTRLGSALAARTAMSCFSRLCFHQKKEEFSGAKCENRHRDEKKSRFAKKAMIAEGRGVYIGKLVSLEKCKFDIERTPTSLFVGVSELRSALDKGPGSASPSPFSPRSITPCTSPTTAQHHRTVVTSQPQQAQVVVSTHQATAQQHPTVLQFIQHQATTRNTGTLG
ncbi:unnamed protein product, partial [Nesidiocoris tenuis]